MPFAVVASLSVILLASCSVHGQSSAAVPATAPATALVTPTPAAVHNIKSARGNMFLVPEGSNTAYPFSAVGQLANGCTGFLIGPCHVMTVAHCVVEPWRKIWWTGLDFYPARNIPPGQGPSSPGWHPLGKATKADVVVHPNWTDDSSGSLGKPAADAAIIITKEAIGKKLGWLDYRLPVPEVIAAAVSRYSDDNSGTQGSARQSSNSGASADRAVPQGPASSPVALVPGLGRWLANASQAVWAGNGSDQARAAGGRNSSSSASPQQQQQLPPPDVLSVLSEIKSTGGRPPSPELMDQLVSSAGLPLHVLGYPDNKPNGSMWGQCCSKLDWQLQGNLLWHDCMVRGGNSGSPVYVVWPPQEPRSSLPAAAAAAGGSDKHVLASNSVATGTGSRKLLQDGQESSSSSSSSSSSTSNSNEQFAAEASYQSQGHVQVVGVHSSSLKFLRNSPTGGYAEAVYAQELAAAASSSSSSNARCVFGAGGRDSGGVNVLLPVAVPFTADTCTWINKVLQEHTCSDG